MRAALIVLAVLATASTSAAGYLVVTSKEIKNGTIEPIDLSARTKLTSRGVTGPRGAAGPRGVRGMPSVVSVYSTPGDLPLVQPGDTQTATAICFSGIVVGGGFFAPSSPDLVAVESRALSDTVWTVRMKNTGSSAEDFTAEALCAR